MVPAPCPCPRYALATLELGHAEGHSWGEHRRPPACPPAAGRRPPPAAGRPTSGGPIGRRPAAFHRIPVAGKSPENVGFSISMWASMGIGWLRRKILCCVPKLLLVLDDILAPQSLVPLAWGFGVGCGSVAGDFLLPARSTLVFNLLCRMWASTCSSLGMGGWGLAGRLGVHARLWECSQLDVGFDGIPLALPANRVQHVLNGRWGSMNLAPQTLVPLAWGLGAAWG